jgi:HTH DNA binding domain
MRRVTLEFNYQAAWKQIFGSYAEKVEILEGLRCFKCDCNPDSIAIAIICRIKLKDKNMNVKDLIGKGLLTNIEVLYKEKDGSEVVFIEGRLRIPQQLPKGARLPKLLVARPPDFLDVDRMKVEVVGKETDVKKILQNASRWSNTYKILGLTSIDKKEEPLLSKLSIKQRQALLTAFALGYYDVPRKISSEELSRHLNADKSTIVEHLRKAEKKLIDGIIAG